MLTVILSPWISAKLTWKRIKSSFSIPSNHSIQALWGLTLWWQERALILPPSWNLSAATSHQLGCQGSGGIWKWDPPTPTFPAHKRLCLKGDNITAFLFRFHFLFRKRGTLISWWVSLWVTAAVSSRWVYSVSTWCRRADLGKSPWTQHSFTEISWKNMRLRLSVAPTNRWIFFSCKAGLTLTLLQPSFVVIVHLPSHVQLFATPWTAARQASLSFTISWSLLKLMSIESMIPSNHLILCHPLLLLPSVFLSTRVFSS